MDYTSDGNGFWEVGHAEKTVNFILKSSDLLNFRKFKL